ncbi:heterokaryon incompatibility protein-domain-containing protein [Xylaria curta]|nr:heterokaryon incompatibility protein-domain-containing protein [Xylaria curta]
MAVIHNPPDVCAKIIKYIQQVKDDSSERIRLMMEIFSIKGILEPLSATLKGAEATPELRSQTIRSINRKEGLLDSLQEVLISVRDELGRAASTKGLERMGESHLWPFEKKDAEERLKVIDTQKLLLTLALDNNHAALSIQSDPCAMRGDTKAISAKDDEGSSGYCYSPLSEQGSIRLLRLMPHEDEKPSYNASPSSTLRRNRFVERILWIDAISISQGNKHEKGQQVQLMAKIYAKANRVIVWLGETPDNNNQVLEVIREAAEEQSMSAAIDEVNEQSIIILLKQPWFQRIWVLQEVAAARYILIMYGSTEIDGYAFCLGLSGLNLSYKTSPDFQGLILPAVYLIIRESIFRSQYQRDEINMSKVFSLNVRPLSELVDMYHTRKATNRLDKVYALLGMSSDDPSESGLSANYNTSWGDVFRKLVEFSLSDQISVST